MCQSNEVKTSPLSLELPELGEHEAETPSRKPEASIIGGLFRTQAGKMRRYLAYRLRSVEDAKDATQDVFLKLWRQERAGQLRPEALAYMYSASHTVAIDSERRRHYHEHDRLPEVDPDTMPADACNLEERQYWRGAIARLVDNLQTLPELTRKVFVLHHFDALDYSQIAAELGVSLRTVERHIALATREMRRSMKEYL